MKRKVILLFSFMSVCFSIAFSQKEKAYWNTNLKIMPLRLPLPPTDYQVKDLDLNGDGKPDAIKSITKNDIPVLWLDDDNNMKKGDIEGDMVNDCLLIDRNKDGIYGGDGDLIVDWVDSNNDGKADMQIVLDYPNEHTTDWGKGHYMIMLDLDKDNVFNYINWNTFDLRCWDKYGIADFYEDYSGKTAFMKIHAPTYNINDLRLNWENPFLFYDEDADGLTEMAIRLLDPLKMKDKIHPENKQLSGNIDWVSIAIDMDNDNGSSNEFDYDFTIGFQGKGFSYADQVHPVRNLRGMPEADQFFMDPRYRSLTEFLYPDHGKAYNLIFKKGEWDRVNFVFDEDDDNGRWERVEFYDPRDPFLVGWNAGGIDNNKQSDAAGDRGEWDMDNSGKGKLYLGRFDGRLHLYGAEWGCWRIDQNAEYYEGWDRMWMNRDPRSFATVKYTDTDNNGFLDCIEYDLDGDKTFETEVHLKDLGVDDICNLIETADMNYKDYTALMKKMSDTMWYNARKALLLAGKFNVQTAWYAKWMRPASVHQKYNYGYWLQFYIYKDLENLFIRKGDEKRLHLLQKAYYGADWGILR